LGQLIGQIKVKPVKNIAKCGGFHKSKNNRI